MTENNNNLPIVQTSLMPFDMGFNTKVVEPNQTLQQIYESTAPLTFNDCNVVMTLNGLVIGKDKWSSTLLTEKDFACINVVPTGGGGGSSGKQIATMVLMVAAAILVPAAAGALAMKAAGTATVGAALGTVSGALTYGGVMIAGSMLTTMAATAIMGTPNQTDSNYENQIEGFIQGASNKIDRFGVIPINLGTNRMFPNQAANPYTETVATNNYVRQMFTFGYGKVQISDEKFGETFISEYSDVETNYRLNADLIEGTSLYTDDVQQDNYSVKLEQYEPLIRTIGQEADEVVIDLTFQTGLYNIYSSKMLEQAWTVNLDVSYKLTESDEWSENMRWSITDFKKEPFSVSKRIVFPEKGIYDIRLNRLSANFTTTGRDGGGNESYLTAIKAFSYINPINQKDISGLAMRIRATDQLSGTVENYNTIVSTLVKSFNPELGVWEDDKVSSNPADLFRYVLQSPAYVKRISDDQIDIKKLEEWWVYCDENNLSFNKIIDTDVSIEDVINDICAAGVATPTKLFNVRSVIIDNERPYVKGLITPRNSWDYSGNITYGELPHALRVEFRNSEIGYESDERIVYRDGYTEENAELYERLQFDSCTNADLAYWYGRRYFATAQLQPEQHNFKMDFENLTFNRGDRIQLVSDIVLVGVGQGRIKELFKDNDGNFTGFRIDDTLSIPVVPVLGCRIRHNNGEVNYYQLSNTSGDNSSFYFSTPLTSDILAVDNLVAFVEDGKELDLIVSEIKPSTDLSATITAIDYAPARFDPIGDIPPFDSNITIPLDLYQPLAPVQVGDIISDESVMIKNSDGSYTSLMSIPLENRNKFDVTCVVRHKLVNATEWSNATYIKNTPTNVQITGLLDGELYDVEVRYQSKINNMMLSNPLVLNGVKFVGNSTPPADVENFNVIITNGLGLFEWTANSDIDISHYEIRYTNDLNEILWQNLQPIFTNIKTTTTTSPIRQGVYMIKAVDIGGNESRNATVITSLDDGSFNNVVEVLQQEPEWTGVKEGCSVISNNLVMNSDVTTAVYTFAEDVDLGQVYECSMAYILNTGVSDEGVTIRTISDIRSLANIRNTLQTDWSSNLEMNLSKDNITWTGWQQFKASQQTFRYAKFRIVMNTEDDRTIVFCSKASVEIDMPDRYESGEDVLITDAQAGLDVVYKTPFYSFPSVNVTVQDGQQGDRVEITNKEKSGFTIKVFNDISNEYVARSFDFISAGYGKVIKTIGG